MATKYPIPSPDKFLSLSCLNVGVGPGGSTAMLACVIRAVKGCYHPLMTFV